MWTLFESIHGSNARNPQNDRDCCLSASTVDALDFQRDRRCPSACPSFGDGPDIQRSYREGPIARTAVTCFWFSMLLLVANEKCGEFFIFQHTEHARHSRDGTGRDGTGRDWTEWQTRGFISPDLWPPTVKNWIIVIIIFIHSESAHAQALASYIVTEFWAGQQDGGPCLLLLPDRLPYKICWEMQRRICQTKFFMTSVNWSSVW